MKILKPLLFIVVVNLLWSCNKAAEEREATKNEGEQFLKEVEQRDGVIKTSSGLLYEVLVEGEGDMPSVNSVVMVHYTGTFIDGEKFDSSLDRGEPSEFGVNQVISGWTEGLQLMNRGAKFKFYIPYQLAYGASGSQSIPPYSALIFEVELIDFQ